MSHCYPYIHKLADPEKRFTSLKKVYHRRKQIRKPLTDPQKSLTYLLHQISVILVTLIYNCKITMNSWLKLNVDIVVQQVIKVFEKLQL